MDVDVVRRCGATPRWRAVERRFLVDADLATEILSWGREELDPDPHGDGPHGDEYDLRTIYFDTPAFDVVMRVSSYGRAKYRIRRYNDEGRAFLERKLRTPALLAKRRSAVASDGVAAVLSGQGGAAPGTDWFTSRLSARNLRPTCVIGYRRAARQWSAVDDLARLTVDTHVLASPFDAADPFATPTTPVVGEQSIVELKYRDVPPAVFKRLMERFTMQQSPMSKYRASARVLGFAGAEAFTNGFPR